MNRYEGFLWIVVFTVWTVAVFMFFSGCGHAPRLVVIRHGEAEHNVSGTFDSGGAAKPSYLTLRGREQVRVAARGMATEGVTAARVDAVYYSPLPRTRETAEIIVRELAIPTGKLTLDPGIIENDMGVLDGSRIEDVLSYFPGGDPWNHSRARVYGGETDNDVASRLRAFLARVCALRPSNNVIVVTHGSPAEILLGLVHEERRSRPHFKNAEFVVLPLRARDCSRVGR